MTDPIHLYDFTGKLTKAYRVGQRNGLGRFIHEFFTRDRDGVLRAMVSITSHHLEDGYYGEAPATGLPSMIDRLRHFATDPANSSEVSVVAQEKVARHEKELARAVALQERLDRGWEYVTEVIEVAPDERLDDLFQEGDERNLFTLLYRYLNTLDRKFVIEEINIF